MHGRVLAPLFYLLALVGSFLFFAARRWGDFSRGDRSLASRRAQRAWLGSRAGRCGAATAGMGDDANGHLFGHRRERRFYAQATGHAHPLTAAGLLDYFR